MRLAAGLGLRPTLRCAAAAPPAAPAPAPALTGHAGLARLAGLAERTPELRAAAALLAMGRVVALPLGWVAPVSDIPSGATPGEGAR